MQRGRRIGGFPVFPSPVLRALRQNPLCYFSQEYDASQKLQGRLGGNNLEPRAANAERRDMPQDPRACPQRAIDNLPDVAVDARKLEDRAGADIARDGGEGSLCSAGPVARGGSQRAQCELGQLCALTWPPRPARGAVAEMVDVLVDYPHGGS